MAPSDAGHDGEIDHDWEFEVGDLVAEEGHISDTMPGAENMGQRTQKEVVSRFIDADSGDRLYQLEYKRDGNIKTTVYSAPVLLNYEKVGEVDDGE